MNRVFQEIQRLWNWGFGKRAEISSLNHRDIFMAHIILEILQTSAKKEFIFLPLWQLQQVHPVDNRKNTTKTTDERIENLKKHESKIRKTKRLSKKVIAKHLPSVTYIRVVQSGENSFLTFEGNGRIAALQAVFPKSDDISIEVELYHPKNLKRTLKKLRKLKKLYARSS